MPQHRANKQRQGEASTPTTCKIKKKGRNEALIYMVSRKKILLEACGVPHEAVLKE